MASPASIEAKLGTSSSPLPAADMSNSSPSTASEPAPVNDDTASTITVNTKTPAANFPPSKTDKPRPHVCTTCQRSFARLEHLKRHERSHTKEKPFECLQCTRCFARRDLLLRHQQKLHQSTTPAARPRNRRESTASATTSRGRKNSMVGTNGTAAAGSVLKDVSGSGSNAVNSASNIMRPRANTIGHVDAANMHMMASTGPPLLPLPPQGFHSRHPSLAGFSLNDSGCLDPQSSAFMGMSDILGHRGMNHGLPRIETHGINPDFSPSLRTASAMPLFSPDFDLDSSVFSSSGGGGGGGGKTINPSALHYTDSPHSLALDPTSAFARGVGGYHDMPSTHDSFDWLTGFESRLAFNTAVDETAVIDESSPSAMSTGSQSDVMLDGSTNPHKDSTSAAPTTSSSHAMPPTMSMWQPTDVIAPHQMDHDSFSLDHLSAASFSDLLSGLPLSPQAPYHTLSHQNASGSMDGSGAAASRNADAYFSTPPPSLSSLSPSLLTALNPANMGHNIGLNGGVPETPTSMNGSNVSNNGKNQNSPNTSSLVSTITDSTRDFIVKALDSAAAKPSLYGMRKYSFTASTSRSASSLGLECPVPSTGDLRRHVAAYLRYFHPICPFLHAPTIFSEVAADSPYSSSGGNMIGAHSCLILSMSAIGALYELEREQSLALFIMAKRMIQLYLDERRKANMRRADFRRVPVGNAFGRYTPLVEDSVDTPTWLVQAMFLNVIYGHNGADKRAGEIASTHSAALVSLAQGAKLHHPIRVDAPAEDLEIDMTDGINVGNLWIGNDLSTPTSKAAKDEALWLRWKRMEERKRTLFAIFTFSSFLVSAYNQTPALTNSEILLDLPCDEEFFSASTSAAFMALGGVAAANQKRMTFHEALGTLLRASEKEQLKRMNGGLTAGLNEPELQPSAFGSFILINALHNYIWETRQRHDSKVWTNEETEKMHRHIEPALQAWQRAWANNPQPPEEGIDMHGLGPLDAVSLPLLDLAYVRLFVNLSRSKEKFWQRNWDGLAEELSHGREVVQHAEQSPISNAGSALSEPLSDVSGNNSSVFADSPATQLSSSPDFGAAKFPPPTPGQLQMRQQQTNRATSRREKHLRKAAFYAADSLCATDKRGFTLSDFGNRELPMQAALCAFDCSQVLAEWVATLQDRVGRYLGILGHDNVDVCQVPAIVLLEEEDVKLLQKIQKVLAMAEAKMSCEVASGVSTRLGSQMQVGEQIGYAAKILSVTAYMLEKSVVWPVTHLMGECLENHASHMRARAEKSILACD